MNNNGDFFIGNTKYSASSGEQTTFQIPTPTVTGQDPSRLSSVFDEVIVKERLLVEGGNSGTILSQFDGPVTFNQELKMNGTVNITALLKETNTTDSTNFNSGAAVFSGGVGINKNLFVGGNAGVSGTTGFTNSVYAYSDVNTVGVVSATTNLTGVGQSGAVRLKAHPTTGYSVLQFLASDGITENANITANPSRFTISTRATQIVLNDSTVVVGVLSVTDDITAFWTSDQRLKDNITPIEDPLAKVLSISGNTFDWNEKSNKSGHDVGVIAQEILEVLPEAVTTRDNGYLAVDYHKVVPLLIEAIKDLANKVEDLQNQINNK
jgi:hypothetical protein